MNKNIFSNSKSGKSSKGFYTALGISALMIGSACYFSYSQGDKRKETKPQTSVSEAAVDRNQPNIPKQTTIIFTTTSISTTTFQTTSTVTETTMAATLPAANIVVEEIPAEETAAHLAAYQAPLADISNIINLFSGTELVKNTTTGSWQTHNGVDIAANIGDDVFSIGSGEVIGINDDPLWGTVVIVDHRNGYVSKYCGLAKELPVQEGNSVKAGDIIGSVSDTADIESGLDPHLHIEVIQNGDFIDPLELFN